MNAREFLGDELVNNLQNAGYTDESIVEFAKKNYFKAMRDERERLSARGLDGATVQAVMRGEISEEAATKPILAQRELDKQAAKLTIDGQDTLLGKAGAATLALLTPGVSNETLARYGVGVGEGASNMLHAYSKLAGNDEWTQKTNDWRKNWAKTSENYKTVNPDKINFAGGLGEFLGEAALDPTTYLTGGSFTVGKGAWAV